MRTTRAIRQSDRFWQSFIDVRCEQALRTNARLGCHFRVFLEASVALEAPIEAASGQRVTWCFIQDATGSRTVTPNGFAVGDGVAIPWVDPAAGVASFVTAFYDDGVKLWRLVPTMTKAYGDALYAAAGSGGTGRLLKVTPLAGAGGAGSPHVMQASTTSHLVEHCGAGGGGGGAATGALATSVGGGGSSGEYYRRWFTNTTPGGSYVYVNTNGGAGGANTGADGADGGVSSIEATPGGTVLQAQGGKGGKGMVTAVTAFDVAMGGACGAGTGAVTIQGRPQDPGGNGYVGSVLIAVSGNGGGNPLGGGAQGRKTQGAGDTPLAASYGGGGAGGCSINGGLGVAGGAGSPSCIIIYEWS